MSADFRKLSNKQEVIKYLRNNVSYVIKGGSMKYYTDDTELIEFLLDRFEFVNCYKEINWVIEIN